MTSDEQSPLTGFALWEPVLRRMRQGNAPVLDAPGGHVSGHISRGSHSVPFRPPGISRDPRERRAAAEAHREEHDIVQRVRTAVFGETDLTQVQFKAEISAAGQARLWLLFPPPTIEPTGGAYPGILVRSADARPEPARRLPAPSPAATPHPSADPELLERMLRQRFPGTTGATEEELAAAEARLGLPLPDELRTLYRVARELHRGPWSEDDDEETARAAERNEISDGMFRELLHSVDHVHIADAACRPPSWQVLARQALITPPGAPVQQLVGSPGWIAFGDDHGNKTYAIDLTPGPGGHVGQVITLPYDEETRAYLEAHSLTDFVRGKFARETPRIEEAPVIAQLVPRTPRTVEDAAHPDLEVLVIGRLEGAPVSLAPVAGLPKLRALIAAPGMLADPTEIGRLTSLEYLEAGPEDWRIILDAQAVPDSLLAARITVRGNPIPRPQPDPLPFFALANEILALWGAPRITETLIEGQLQ